MSRSLLLIMMVLLRAANSFSQEQKPVDIFVSFYPGKVILNNIPTIYYELSFRNISKDTIDLREVEVFDPANDKIHFIMDTADLKIRHSAINAAKSSSPSYKLLPGSTGMVYIELSFQNNRSTLQLLHRVTLAMPHNKDLIVTGAPLKVAKKSPVVLGPPLYGGPWAAVYEPSWARGHRRVTYKIDGQIRIPGRYAIDFIRLTSEGRYAKDNEDSIKNWYGYNMEVLAVANGVIASINDSFTESATLSGHPKYDSSKATGNYISIDIGNNNFVFYEHLKPGSILVTPGQRVKKGEVIAAIGFTGQTTGPHLHFHVANANSSLGAEGVAFSFEQFTMLGSYPVFDSFGKEPWTPIKDTDRALLTEEHPAPNVVVSFD